PLTSAPSPRVRLRYWRQPQPLADPISQRSEKRVQVIGQLPDLTVQLPHLFVERKGPARALFEVRFGSVQLLDAGAQVASAFSAVLLQAVEVRYRGFELRIELQRPGGALREF